MKVDGDAIWAEACRVAGVLAERGVQRLRLCTAEGSRELTARSTDLPRELAAAPIGSRLEFVGGGLVLVEGGWREATGSVDH